MCKKNSAQINIAMEHVHVENRLKRGFLFFFLPSSILVQASWKRWMELLLIPRYVLLWSRQQQIIKKIL
jgi:hypothetical protein